MDQLDILLFIICGDIFVECLLALWHLFQLRGSMPLSSKCRLSSKIPAWAPKMK